MQFHFSVNENLLAYEFSLQSVQYTVDFVGKWEGYGEVLKRIEEERIFERMTISIASDYLNFLFVCFYLFDLQMNDMLFPFYGL